MENAPSLKTSAMAKALGLLMLVIVNHSRFFGGLGFQNFLSVIFNTIQHRGNGSPNYGPFRLIIVMRKHSSLTYC